MTPDFTSDSKEAACILPRPLKDCAKPSGKTSTSRRDPTQQPATLAQGGAALLPERRKPPASALSRKVAGQAVEDRFPVGMAMQEALPHALAIHQAWQALDWHFRRIGQRSGVFIAMNMALLFKAVGKRAKLVPDLLVAFDPVGRPKSSYSVPRQGKPPDFVLEVTSPSTAQRDRNRKKTQYAAMGVREYWLFDPSAKYLKPPLQGFRLEGAEYARVAPNAEGRLASKALDLELQAEGWSLRFFDPITARLIPTHEETHAARVEAVLAKDAEAKKRRMAEGALDAERQTSRNAQQQAAKATAERDAQRQTSRSAQQQAAKATAECDAQRETSRSLEKQVAELERRLAALEPSDPFRNRSRTP